MSKEHTQDTVREEFKKLNLDGKTAFLVEAIFSTAGSAINEIGTRLNSLVSLVTDPFEASDESQDAGAGAAKAAAGDSAEAEAESKDGSSAAKKSGSSKGGTSKK